MTTMSGVESPQPAGQSKRAGQSQRAVRRRPGRPPAGSEDKRERILTEAVSLFSSRGYAATSLADIADAAHISKAGLLHHYPSKDELFAKVLQRRDEEANRDVFGEMNIDDPWGRFDAFVRLIEYNVQRRELVALYTATTVSVMDAQHPAHEWFATHLRLSTIGFEESLERGKELGLVKPQAPSRLIARTLTALSDGLQIQWLCSTTPGSAADEVIATDMVEEIRLYVDGLKQLWSQ